MRSEAIINLEDYGYDPRRHTTPGEGLLPARIVWVRRGRYGAVCEVGDVTATPSGRLLHRANAASELPAVGDFVHLRLNAGGPSTIECVLPRTSRFSRVDLSGHIDGYAKTALEQVVAANFDDVFVLSSLNADLNPRRIARYVTQARRGGGRPVIVLTKADLCADREPMIGSVRDIAPDVPIVAVSSVTGEGFDVLSGFLRPGRTIALLGMSGVGKSTLLNRIAGAEWMAVGEIRTGDARGRHTTTHRELFRLSSGALIIDTPGMRELGLWDAEDGIRLSFPDVGEIIARCRFANCRHDTEPGCAVRAALENGELSAGRWQAYTAQMREAAKVARMSRRGGGRDVPGKAAPRDDLPRKPLGTTNARLKYRTYDDEKGDSPFEN